MRQFYIPVQFMHTLGVFPGLVGRNPCAVRVLFSTYCLIIVLFAALFSGKAGKTLAGWVLGGFAGD